MSSNIFQKIIDKEIPADIVYEDEFCLAFNDVNPQAPIHILLLPKKPINMLADVVESDSQLMGHLLTKVPEITRKFDISDNFRLVINNGPKACQSVYYLHFHILAGRDFTWPPG